MAKKKPNTDHLQPSAFAQRTATAQTPMDFESVEFRDMRAVEQISGHVHHNHPPGLERWLESVREDAYDLQRSVTLTLVKLKSGRDYRERFRFLGQLFEVETDLTRHELRIRQLDT